MVQWSHPEEFEESNNLILMGGLHIEMAIISVISGWTEIIISVIGVLLEEGGWTEMITVMGVLLQDSG